MSNELKAIGECQICGVNVYDRGKLNKPFMHLGREKKGYPAAAAMPCGVNREPSVLAELKKLGFSPEKDLTPSQHKRCPFETKEEQDAIEIKKGIGIFSGQNTYESMG